MSNDRRSAWFWGAVATAAVAIGGIGLFLLVSRNVRQSPAVIHVEEIERGNPPEIDPADLLEAEQNLGQ